MPFDSLDPKKLHELASRPGTFPEMVQSTYNAGLEAGLEAGKQENEAMGASLRRLMRTILGIVSVLLAIWAACILYCAW